MIRINQFKPIIFILLMFLFSFLCGDGFIVINPNGGIYPPPHPHPRPVPPPIMNPFPLEVVYHRVQVQIDDQVALTSIDQEFFNPTNQRLEGYYLFPLPTNAVIKKFSMFIDGKEMQAELLEAVKARSIYEDIVRRQRDPALLEYTDRGVFKARIFPIEPRSSKRVKISYSELLPKDNQTIEYLYPLNTEKFSAKPLNDVSIHVEVNTTETIKNIYCPTHKIEINRKGNNRAIAGYEEKKTKPDQDFKLYITTDNDKLGFSLLSYKPSHEDGYFLLSLSPGFGSSKDEITEKDIIFVADVSGSMAGEKMKQLIRALLFCIENLNKGDRFEIIRFSTEAEALFDGFVSADEKNLSRARQFINGLKPIGGTNMDEALSIALRMKKREGRPCMVIFMTDGKPTIGETDEDSLLAKVKQMNTGQFRVFSFGIGEEINTHLLDKLTQMTRAYCSYITPDEDIEVKVSNFYTKVQSPVMTDIKLRFGAGIKVLQAYPTDLPDLFKGSALTLLGRYRGDGDADIYLTGNIRGKREEIHFSSVKGFRSESAADALRNEFIAPLWGARRVGYLLEQIRLHGSNKELVDEVTQLARTYGIITPYTSYLIVEDEKTNVQQQVIRREDQTLGRIAEQDRDFENRNMQEYAALQSKSGASSVQASKTLRSISKTEYYSEARPSAPSLNYKDQSGYSRNVQQQVKNIRGRAFYNVNNYWVDSLVQKQKSQAVKRIQFAGTEYWTLLKKEPKAAQFLALGKNIRFVLNNMIYEIHE